MSQAWAGSIAIGAHRPTAYDQAMSDILVRTLARADAPAYRDLRLEALRRNPEAFSSTLEIELARPMSWFEERQGGREMFGAFRGADLVGMAGFVPLQGPKKAHRAMLVSMYVDPSARGLGVGKRLVDAVIAHAQGRVEALQVGVVAGNDAAHRLYLDAGFVEYGADRKALKQDGRYDDEILMVLDLAAAW